MEYRRRYFEGEVTSPLIVPEAVTEEKIADNAVTSRKIKDDEVKSVDIGPGQVRTEDIADGAVTLAKLGGDVSVIPLMDGSVTNTKLATDAVTSDKIAAGAVGSSQLAVGSVESIKIKDGAVTNAKIATNTITAGKIAAGAVNSSELAVDSVTTPKIANGAVTAEKLAPGVGGGDTLTFLPTSVEALYLTDITADIPYTALDLSAYVPAQAKAVILQLGIFNQAFTSGRAFFRVRTNTDQRDALGLGLIPGQNSQTANQGIVPLVVGTEPRTVEYALESVGGPWIGTLTLYITVVGYIV
ncbi:MAG: hypothetical protein AB1599_07470 [Planctomycetota bacterium]